MLEEMIIDSLKYNGMCSCGKEHKMETELCVIGSGCLKEAGNYLERFHLNGFTVAVYDENTYKATADRHPNVNMEIILNAENLHANEHGVHLLWQELPEQTEVLIAVGSGTIHDITRYCAYQKGVPFVSCPTAASVDGFCSSVAAMTWHGCKKTLTAVSPKIVIADIDVIKKAPIRLAKSGFGDMIGKYVALTEWKIAHILTGEYYCERIARMTAEATEAVLASAEGIIQGSEQAYGNLMYGLLLSGLAMQMLGNSRPASGAEHHISHFIEMEPAGLGIHSDALHGEKVGVGTLLVLEEYQRLAALKAVSFKDYEKFKETDIMELFGEDMTKELSKENEKDCAVGITGEGLEKNWEKICSEIAKLPNAEKMRDLYRKTGIKSTLADINVPNENREALLQYSPAVRNRLTLMRIRKCVIEQ